MKDVKIKVKGHVGTWHIIDKMYSPYFKQMIYLLEHDRYGDGAACVIAGEDGSLIMDEVYNGFDDLEPLIDEIEREGMEG